MSAVEEENTFDPTLLKKKKKKTKSVAFAVGEEGSESPAVEEGTVEESDPNLIFGAKKKKKKSTSAASVEEDAAEEDAGDLESSMDNLALDGKKKKKNPTSDDTADNVEGSSVEPEDNEAEDFAAFSGMKKKKKKKSSSAEDLPSAAAGEDLEVEGSVEEETDESSTIPMEYVCDHTRKLSFYDNCNRRKFTDLPQSSDRDYTFTELLSRVFHIIQSNNPEFSGEKRKYTMVPPQVAREGSKKTVFINIQDICRRMRRQPEHLVAFLYAELGTEGSMDGGGRLVIKGRFQQKQMEIILKRYIVEYVTCKTCRSPDTYLAKENRLFFLKCESCGSARAVTAIKSGFRAQTGKRRKEG